MLPNSSINSRPPIIINIHDIHAIAMMAFCGFLFFRFDSQSGKYPSFAITDINLDEPKIVPMIALLVASMAPRITRLVPKLPSIIPAPAARASSLSLIISSVGMANNAPQDMTT